MSDIPQRMYTAGRTPQQDFAPEEKLWRRIKKEHAFPNGRIDLGAIELPDISVNRENDDGEPRDLLLNEHAGWGVAEFRVDDIPSPQVYRGFEKYDFVPVHVPEKKNWYHSEIRGYRSGDHVSTAQGFPEEVSRQWRHRMRQRMRLVMFPSEDS